MPKNDSPVSTEDFEAALDKALMQAMTQGVPLMSRGEPILDNKGNPIFVTPGADILGVAERRAKAKRIGQGGSAPTADEVAAILADAGKARSKGGALPPVIRDDEDERG